MKLVVDTNVLVSAVLRGGLPERVLMAIIARDDWHWLVTADLLAEYERVVRRPRLGIPLETQEEWLRLVRQDCIQLDLRLRSIEFPRDRKDVKVLQAAVAAEADYVITGDKDFAEAQSLITSLVVTVREFAGRFGIH